MKQVHLHVGDYSEVGVAWLDWSTTEEERRGMLDAGGQGTLSLAGASSAMHLLNSFLAPAAQIPPRLQTNKELWRDIRVQFNIEIRVR